MVSSGCCVMELEIIYFRRRASEERTAALQARNAPARRAHVALAEEYEGRVREMFAGMGAAVSTHAALAQRAQKREPLVLSPRF